MKKMISLLLIAVLVCSFLPAAFAEREIPYQVENGGFETGDFTGWILPEGWPTDENGNPKGLSSDKTYWAEEMPFNQAGEYHLDSWALQPEIPEPDPWYITSSHFILGGVGYITVRMGGRTAAVKVFKADGTQIGLFRNRHFKDSGFPSVKKGVGGSWADMATFIIDLSEYIGEEMYLELWDEESPGSWAVAFFDEVVTLYDEIPDYKTMFDLVKDGNSTEMVEIPWQRTLNTYNGI